MLVFSGCSVVEKTLDMEQRIFVRVPGKMIEDPVSLQSRGGKGWCFKHVVEAPRSEAGVPQNWYLAWKLGEPRSQLGSRIPRWKTVRSMAVEISRDVHEIFGCYPVLIEPGLVFKEEASRSPGHCLLAGATNAPGGLPKATIRSLPKKVWSSEKTEDGRVDPLWHLDDEHSQLASARAEVRRQAGAAAKSIKIGILDNGFDARHPIRPVHFIDEPAANALQALIPPGPDQNSDKGCLAAPGQTYGSHGTGAVGILAGRKVQVAPHPGVALPADGVIEIGAAPDAEVVAVRVAPEMASLSTANFAYGIDYASRVKRCDVLSISHGGSASYMWADAVNSAYDRGTAMFAATGDYFPLPLAPLYTHRLGIIVPSSTVYPAAFRRVVGVAGVTSDGKSYGRTDWRRYYLNFWKPDQIGSSFMRGSYGADHVRRSLLDAWLWREDAKTDRTQVRRKNILRANPISAFSPAIP